MSSDWIENVTQLPFMDPNEDVEVLNVEVIEHKPPVTERSLARRIALQVLYEVDCTNHQAGQVLVSRLQAQNIGLESRSTRYVRALVMGTLEQREGIDRVISHFATEWPLNQIAVVDRNVMRLAIYEMLFDAAIPQAVAIDEAIGLIELFGAESSVGFVNGVLGEIADRPKLVKAILGLPDDGADEEKA